MLIYKEQRKSKLPVAGGEELFNAERAEQRGDMERVGKTWRRCLLSLPND